MSRLRKYLGNEVSIVRQAPGYVLRIGSSQLDLQKSEHLADLCHNEIKAKRYKDAARHAREALSLWKGPPLANATEFLAKAEQPRLEEARIAILEDRIEADLALGRHVELIPELTGLVLDFPLWEQLRAQLMIALHRSGRQADALATFYEGRRILEEELGVDPGGVLTGAFQKILEGGPSPVHQPEEQNEPATVECGIARPAMLPPDIPDLVGRAKHLAELCDPIRRGGSGTLSSPQVCLISGMAGIGKSALAVHAAHMLAEDFPDGQLYVDLAGDGERDIHPSDILGWFLRALGVSDRDIPDGQEERTLLYRSSLVDRSMIVVLDNATNEQQVRPLIPGGGRCSVMVTSRRTLAGLDGDQLMELDVLDSSESWSMLAGIVGRERLGVELDHAQRIVDHCAGLPLALRAVGARLVAKRHWLLARIVDQLDGLGSRLDALAFGDLNVRSRFAMSYQELSMVEQVSYRRLGVSGLSDFPAAVAAEILRVSVSVGEEIVESLVDAKVLGIDSVDRHGQPHYGFHELFRQFARELAIHEPAI